MNSWGPATRFYCVHYFCFHSKLSHLLSPLGWDAIWFWLLSAAVACWCACDLTLLFAECAVDTAQKRKAQYVMSHSHGFFAEGLNLRCNPCALCVLRKDGKSLGTERSHPEVSAIGTIVPEVFSNSEESLSHEGPQNLPSVVILVKSNQGLGPASYCILSRDGNKRNNKRKRAHQPSD